MGHNVNIQQSQATADRERNGAASGSGTLKNDGTVLLMMVSSWIFCFAFACLILACQFWARLDSGRSFMFRPKAHASEVSAMTWRTDGIVGVFGTGYVYTSVRLEPTVTTVEASSPVKKTPDQHPGMPPLSSAVHAATHVVIFLPPQISCAGPRNRGRSSAPRMLSEIDPAQLTSMISEFDPSQLTSDGLSRLEFLRQTALSVLSSPAPPSCAYMPPSFTVTSLSMRSKRC